MSSRRLGHVPVLLSEVITALVPRDEALYVDGTFGGGGYAAALLDSALCRVVAIDRDPAAVAAGSALARQSGGRLELAVGRFGDMKAILDRSGITSVDGGIVLDLGVSSLQLDQPERGFSFRHDGPLDMRMGGDGATAADIVNSLDEAQLGAIIRDLGEERRWRRVARAIVAARAEAPIATTARLAAVVRQVVPAGRDRIDPATRTFQALRLCVNDELGELARGLDAAERLLAAGARLAVVSFHSLEDRTVKTFLHRRSGGGARPSRHVPDRGEDAPAPSFTLLNRRPVTPNADEIAANPRARSARLRAAIRTAAPPWDDRRAA